jgi:hypothetical protein
MDVGNLHFCMLIFRRGDEVRPIWGPLEVGNWQVRFVNFNIEELLSGLGGL